MTNSYSGLLSYTELLDLVSFLSILYGTIELTVGFFGL
jgi:hypothetical protein